MRRLALLLVLALAACGSEEQVESAISEGYAKDWPRIGRQTLSRWSSFPVDADPRPLVLLGEPVSADNEVLEGGVAADGKVPPEAAEAFAKLNKPGTGEPKLKVVSVEKGMASFTTDRGPRELPAWIFRVTGVDKPAAVLESKPDFQHPATIYGATVSGDGLTLTVRMPGPPVPCVGEPRITYLAEWLESPTAVAVGLKKRAGKVMPGDAARCRGTHNNTAEYTINLNSPLGNRVLVGANSEPLPVSATQP